MTLQQANLSAKRNVKDRKITKTQKYITVKTRVDLSGMFTLTLRVEGENQQQGVLPIPIRAGQYISNQS